MIFTNIKFLLPFLAIATAYPYNSYNCGLEPGVNVCDDPNQNCAPLVVRPQPVPKPVFPEPKVVCTPVGGIPPLNPLKNPCSCHTSLVKPAVVPKPICSACQGYSSYANQQQCSCSRKCSCSQQYNSAACGCNKGPLPLPGPYPLPVATPILVEDDASPVNPASFVPADPVSMHVAYQLAQESNCYLNEDKLAFGFRTIPKDLPLYVTKTGNCIPEENLLSLNGQIVELKKIPCKSVKSLEEEAREQLIQLAEEEAEGYLDAGLQNAKPLTLGEIGYGPANIKQPVFINVPATAGNIPDDGLRLPVKNCNDGFVPGNVVIKENFMPDNLALPPVLPDPCPEDCDIPQPVHQCSSYSSSHSAASSASSCSYKKGILLQKLGCRC